MNSLFIQILNMSIMAGITACVVILIRLLLKKAPKIFSYALWVVVLFRLLCPFTFESIYSLMPANPNTVPQTIVNTNAPSIKSNIQPVDDAVNFYLATNIPNDKDQSDYPAMLGVMEVCAFVWLIGLVSLFSYTLFSYLILKRRLKASTLVRDNIYETDRITTPFVLGFIKPKIYIPIGMKSVGYILQHEQTHIRRRDHLIKPIAFLALCLHWFNPVIWLSYFLMCKDMEMSCDESVLGHSTSDIRADYSGSLLSLSASRSGLLSPLAFGESNTKTRIKNVLGYKKPALWISIIAIIAVLGVTVGFMANSPTINTDGNGEFPIEIENSNFLGSDGYVQYYWVFEEDNCVLYSLDKNELAAKQLAVFTPLKNEGSDPTLNSIIDFGICGDWIIVSVGHYEGSGNYFYGDFVRMKKDGSELEHFWLTDDDTFTIVDDWIYYNFWTVKDSPADGDGCYRIRPDGTGKEYMGDIIHSIFLYDQDGYVYGEHDTGKPINGWNPITDLIRCKPDGSGLITLFSGDSLPKFINSDYMRYSDIEVNNEYVAFTAAVHGYSEGDSWRGHYNYIADFRVNKDGSNLALLREEYPLSNTTNANTEKPSGTLYTNERLGFSVEFPASWDGLIEISENYVEYDERGGAGIAVYHRASREKSNPNITGTLFYIERWIGTWTTENPPIYAGGCFVVLQTGKYTYMLRTTSGVEYNENNPQMVAECQMILSMLDTVQANVRSVGSGYAGVAAEKEFLDSSGGKQLRETAYATAKAMLKADEEELAKYLANPKDAPRILRNLSDAYDDLAWLCFKFTLDSIISDDEIRPSYEYCLSGEDSYAYVSMVLKKVNNEWKVSEIGLEK